MLSRFRFVVRFFKSHFFTLASIIISYQGLMYDFLEGGGCGTTKLFFRALPNRYKDTFLTKASAPPANFRKKAPKIVGQPQLAVQPKEF